MPEMSADTRVRDALSPHADAFESAANDVDELSQADALRVLAALGKGETVDEDVLARIRERAETGDQG